MMAYACGGVYIGNWKNGKKEGNGVFSIECKSENENKDPMYEVVEYSGNWHKDMLKTPYKTPRPWQTKSWKVGQ
jgi:hypothetical protein